MLHSSDSVGMSQSSSSGTHSSQAVSHAAASHFPFSFRSHPDGSVADVLLTEQLSQWWGAQFGLF